MDENKNVRCTGWEFVIEKTESVHVVDAQRPADPLEAFPWLRAEAQVASRRGEEPGSAKMLNVEASEYSSVVFPTLGRRSSRRMLFDTVSTGSMTATADFEFVYQSECLSNHFTWRILAPIIRPECGQEHRASDSAEGALPLASWKVSLRRRVSGSRALKTGALTAKLVIVRSQVGLELSGRTW